MTTVSTCSARRLITAIALVLVAADARGQVAPPTSPDEKYTLGPDSRPQPGVPEGRVTEFTLVDSKVYPGYRHKWWLYVPAQYDGKTPLALMVFLDGAYLSFVQREGAWRVPVVLDNLIARKELPHMAAIFIDPGERIRDPNEFEDHRSYEYDTLNDRYATFLLSEILPEAHKHVKLSADPNRRGIAGRSSGGIGAFTVAWQMPNEFRKVFSANGSFVNIRGGGVYPEIIRQERPRPLRVFLQDGVNDSLGGEFKGLNWPEGNRAMAAALALRGYDYQLAMGDGTHSGRHGAAIFSRGTLQRCWHCDDRKARGALCASAGCVASRGCEQWVSRAVARAVRLFVNGEQRPFRRRSADPERSCDVPREQRDRQGAWRQATRRREVAECECGNFLGADGEFQREPGLLRDHHQGSHRALGEFRGCTGACVPSAELQHHR